MQNDDNVIRIKKEECGSDIIKISRWDIKIDKSALKSQALSYSKGMGVGLVPAFLCSAFMGWLILLIPSAVGKFFAAALAVGVGWGTTLLIKKISEQSEDKWIIILAIFTMSLGILLGPYICFQNRANGFMAYLLAEPIIKLIELGYGVVGVILGTRIKFGGRGVQQPQIATIDNTSVQHPTSTRQQPELTVNPPPRVAPRDSSGITFTESISGGCPICGEPLSAKPVKPCPECRTPHHVECWNYNGGCGVFGCSLNPASNHH